MIAVPTIERASRVLIAGALLVGTLGFVALAIAGAPATVAEFGALVNWYFFDRAAGTPLLVVSCGLVGLVGVALLVVRTRAGIIWGRELSTGAVPQRLAGAFTPEQLTREAKRVLEPFISGRPRISETVDALLGLPVDFHAAELVADVRDGAVQLELRVAMTRTPVTTMPLGIYERVLEELARIAGIDGDQGEGGLELRQSSGTEQIRVTIAPSVGGRRLRIQVMSRMAIALTIEELRMPPAVLEPFARALEQRVGLVVVAGNRGQGVTTTVYAAAHYIDRYRKEPGLIASLEAPVRHELPFVHQAEAGDAPAAVLESLVNRGYGALFVRQLDDPATARVALRAAQKRLVIVSINAPEWRGAMARLAELAGEPLPPALVVGQRLVRRNCSACAAPLAGDAREGALLKAAGIPLPAAAQLRKGGGCRACGKRGVSGRLPLYELVRLARGADPRSATPVATIQKGLAALLADGEISTAEALGVLESSEEARA